MSNKTPIGRARGPPLPGTAELEEMLGEVPTLATDVRRFLRAIGWSDYSPAYRDESEEQTQRFDSIYSRRRAKLSRRDRGLETRAGTALQANYRARFTTLGDLKNVVESRGPDDVRGLGYAGIARFNQVLQHYGLEQLRIGGNPSSYALRRYGLEPVRPRADRS